MAANSFGRLFRITTWGESHGAGIGVIIDGVPAGIPLALNDIQKELDRRKPGQSSLTTMRKEADQAEILSGIFEGQTTGTPLTIYIKNQDQISKDYTTIKDKYRPGHADYTYQQKYGIRDYRGGGRSSGRETAARVAAGAIAKKVLAAFNITVTAYTKSIGDITVEQIDLTCIENNPVRCPDPNIANTMADAIQKAKETNDSIGGIVEALITGVPVGIGDPVFEKLDALIGQALFSIGSIKGVEIGEGFNAAKLFGSQNNDEFFCNKEKIYTRTNHAGGILGGISNGENIIVRCAVKPTPSISQAQKTVNINKEEVEILTKGRHDPCLCPRIIPVIEAMLAITILDSLLIQRAYQNNL